MSFEKRSRRVLGIVASPHNSGNTAILVREVLRGAKDRGYETELKCLGDLTINPLEAAPQDKRNKYGISCPKDDMELIYPFLDTMNIFVFGTPIYFDHISDRAKIFIDRLIYYSDKKERFPKNVSAVIILTYEWDKIDGYTSVVEWIEGRAKQYWKMKVVASLQAENTVKNPVIIREDLLKKAYQIGMNL